MRVRTQPTREQRIALREALARIQRPGEALALARRCPHDGFEPVSATCTLRSLHPDRFVMELRLHANTGEELGFALKAYADDFAEWMWSFARSLAQKKPWNHAGLCLPLLHLREESALVFPWVEGVRLSEIVDRRKPDLLRRAATLAGGIHRTRGAVVPELVLDMVIAEALDRAHRIRSRWPALEVTVLTLGRLLEEAAAGLDPAPRALIHGDLAAGQFLWTGERLILLDLDTACLGDPAYDIGHFLGQLERRCTLDTGLPRHARGWADCFREAYPAEAVGISWRNVSFYQGVTLFRKMFTLCRRDPVAGARLASLLAPRARAAFEAVLSCRGRSCA